MFRAEDTNVLGDGASALGFFIPLIAVDTRPGVMHWEGEGGEE